VLGQKISHVIKSRVSLIDQILQQQMLPFAMSADGHPLIQALSTTNRFLKSFLLFCFFWVFMVYAIPTTIALNPSIQ